MMSPDDDKRIKSSSLDSGYHNHASPATALPSRAGFDDDTISMTRSQTMSLDFIDESYRNEHVDATTTLDDKSIFQRAYDLIDLTARRIRRSRPTDIDHSHDVEEGRVGYSPGIARAQAKAAGVYADNGKGKRGRPAASDPGAEYVQTRAPGLSPAFYLRFLRRTDEGKASDNNNDDSLVSTLEEAVVARCESAMPSIPEDRSASTPICPPKPLTPIEQLTLDESRLKPFRECCVFGIIIYAILAAIILGEVYGFQ